MNDRQQAMDVQLPDFHAGTVTFLFTDIEGSTQLLERLRDRYADLLAEHHRLLREVFARWQGQEVDTQGDAFFVAFPRAGDAIGAVVEAQQALSQHRWPGAADVRVRMGLHTGEPWVVAEGYVGMDVHRAARIAHAGHGGQVLLSETTTALVLDDLPEGVSLLDLGRHQLKDMRRPEHIQQLVIEGLPADFSPLSSLVALPPLQAPTLGGDGAREPREVGPSPYRGLAAFREADAAFFFGREGFTEQLAAAVRQRELVAVIVGPSGSGKSSVVFAGLLPELADEGSWLVVALRPGSRPFHALVSALLPLLEEDLSEADRLIEVEKLGQAMAAGDLPLFQVVEWVLARHPEAGRLLLVIDQFEELFTQRPDPGEQRQFLDELLAASQAGSARWTSPLVILLTLRADFMGQALAHRPFADALQAGSLLLGPMNRSELQAAVEKPAELQGAAFERGLVERILDDVGEEPGNLPLLEFALSLLWEGMDQGWLTHEAYDQIGRVDGALARYAEEVYEALSEEHQAAARRIFVQLVQPGEGTEDTRRVARRAELGEGSRPLVQHLADKRLIVTSRDEGGQETVEVVHEALIRSWQRLRGWIEADRAFRVWQEGLRAAMRGWEASERDEGGLLRGAPLITAEAWLAEREAELSQAERDYIAASVDLRGREQARRERRRRLIVAGLASGMVVALILLAIALTQGSIARENAQLAGQSAATAEVESQSRATAQAAAEIEARTRATAQAEAEAERSRAEEEVQARATAQAAAEAAEVNALIQASIGLASQSALELKGGSPERAIPLALEALEHYPYTPQAERALSRAVFENHLRHVLPHGSGVNTAFWSPDGVHILTATDDAARVWGAATGAELMTLRPDDPMFAAGWSPDGDRIWIEEQDTASIWDARTGDRLVTLIGHEDLVHPLSWSPEGDRILTTSDDTTARIWDANTGAAVSVFTGHDAVAWSCLSLCTPETSAWSPDGDRVVTMDEAGEVFIWDPATGEALAQLSGHAEWVNSAVWSPDGQRIATASDDGTAKVWDANTGEELLSYSAPDNSSSPAYAQWSQDGTRLLSHDDLGQPVVVWDVNSGQEIVVFDEHDGVVNWTEWSSDDSMILSGGADGTARIWDSDMGAVMHEFSGHGQPIEFVRWSPSNDQVMTASQDGTVKVWDLAAQLTQMQDPGENGGAWAYDWSPSGDRVARNNLDGSVDVFDAETGEKLAQVPAPQPGRNQIYHAVKFSPSGEELLTAAMGGLAVVHDAWSGEELMQVGEERTWGFSEADWSPDGSKFATGSHDGLIQIWDARTGDERLAFAGHQGPDYNEPVAWVRWSPDGQRIASTSKGRAFIWDASTGEVLLDVLPEDFELEIEEPAWSPDGTLLAVGRGDGVLVIWDTAIGQQVQAIATGVTAFEVDWFAAQDRLLTSDRAGNVKIWDIATGAEVARFNFPGSWSAYLSPDGEQVLVGMWPNGPLIIFDIWQNLDELIELAKECCVFRDLTPEERQQFGLPPVAEGD